MTVITLARKYALLTSFDSERKYIGKKPFADFGSIWSARSFADLAFCFGAAVSIAAVLAIVVSGVHSSILMLKLSKNNAQIEKLGEETEALRLQSFQLIKPDTLSAEAGVLKLVEQSSKVRYVTPGTHETLARIK